jgi:hypothetical protein
MDTKYFPIGDGADWQAKASGIIAMHLTKFLELNKNFVY